MADWRQLLVYRATDRWLSRRPLSVATDRIAYPAMRVARVLDIPEALGLLAPRKLTLINAKYKAFDRTAEIYKRAGAADKFKRE